MQRKKKRQMTKEQCLLVTDASVAKCVKAVATRFGNKYKSVGYDEFYSIGIAAACEQAMRFSPDKDSSFITFMTPYVVGEMAWYVQKYVNGAYLDKQEKFFAELCYIDEMVQTRADEDENAGASEQILSAIVNDEEERQKLISERVENILSLLAAGERELLMIRYGFFDNNGETADEYIRKHKISKLTFYRKARRIELKIINHYKSLSV